MSSAAEKAEYKKKKKATVGIFFFFLQKEIPSLTFSKVEVVESLKGIGDLLNLCNVVLQLVCEVDIPVGSQIPSKSKNKKSEEKKKKKKKKGTKT